MAPGLPLGRMCCIVAAAGAAVDGTRGIVTFTRVAPAAQVYRPVPLITTWLALIATIGASTRIEPKYETVAPEMA